MEDFEVRVRKVKEITHIFYCDNCQKKIGESTECDDGYYEEEGKYEQSIYINDIGWYNLKLHLCDECTSIYEKRLIETLQNLGFKERN